MALRSRTNDVLPGAGNPRLVSASHGHAPAGGPRAEGAPPEFLLDRDLTTIGSAEDQDLQLAGLQPAHGDVRRVAEGDEYVYRHASTGGTSRVNGVPVTSAGLHHGDRVELDSWVLIFQRDEFADHGRFDGGRQGGESTRRSGHPSDGSEDEPRRSSHS